MALPKHAKNPLTQGLPERRYLPELHGVRGLALLGVVVFHLFGSGRISGGIDIFLAISGFLFTGMLLREAAATGGSIDFFKYFGRLIRRIFVPAAIVAVATLLISLLLSPVTRHRQLWAEFKASLLYYENHELINSQLAYGAAGPETSPFQHFWSLSVQGQFYLLWPLVAIVAVGIAKAIRVSAVRVMAIAAGTIFAFSFAYAIYVGAYDQDAAYLMTSTRAWQLAFGALLALAGSTIRLPQFLRGPAGWVGIALIVTCGIFLDGAQLFPGPWAFWPLSGLALVLMSAGPTGGNNDSPGSATRFLANRPLAWIGDHAYGLYLWHWPLLIFYLEFRDREAIGYRGALVILAVTAVLAILMHRYVETRLQRVPKQGDASSARSSDRMTVVAGGGLVIVTAFVATAFTPSLDDLDYAYSHLDPEVYPGAAVHFASGPIPEADAFPPLNEVEQYKPEYIARGCQQRGGQAPGRGEISVCEDENAPDHPTATVVLAGGSHAGHLEAAFQVLGRKYGWEVLIVTKPSCVFGWEEQPDQERCGEWNANFITWLSENPVDLVVTPGTRLPNSGGPEYILERAPYWWEEIAATDTELLLVRGMPRQSRNAPDCLAEGGSIQECGPSKEGYADSNPLEEMDLPTNVHPIDVTPYVCPQINDVEADNCDAVVGNIVVSYDNHHFTTPFSQSLAPAFEAEMEAVVPHLLR